MPIKTVEENRRAFALGLLAESKLDALLVTKLHNVRYLTGFTGSNGAVLLSRKKAAILFTDPRYTVQSQQQVNCSVRIAKGGLAKAILHEIDRAGVRRVGFEQDHFTVAQFEAFGKGLPARAQLQPTSGLIERLRMIKDAGEIERIRASCITNSRALDAALKRLRIGMRESELAAEIDYQNRKLGAEAPSFDTIVAAGERSALPHAHAGRVEDRTGNPADRYGRVSRRLRERHDPDGSCGAGHAEVQAGVPRGARSAACCDRCRETGRHHQFGRPRRAEHAEAATVLTANLSTPPAMAWDSRFMKPRASGRKTRRGSKPEWRSRSSRGFTWKAGEGFGSKILCW